MQSDCFRHIITIPPFNAVMEPYGHRMQESESWERGHYHAYDETSVLMFRFQ